MKHPLLATLIAWAIFSGFVKAPAPVDAMPSEIGCLDSGSVCPTL